MIEVIRKCMKMVGTGRRLKWGGLLLLALIATGMEAIGAGLVFVLLALVSDPTATPELPLAGDISRFIPGMERDILLVAVATSIALFFIARGILVFTQTYLQQRVVHNAGAQLATRLMRGYMAMPYAFHLQRNSSELIRNALQSVQSVISHVLVNAVRLATEMFLVVGLVGILVAVSPTATLLAAGLLGPLVWLVMRTIHPRVKRLGRVAQSEIKESLQTAQQSLEGIRDVKLLGRERHFARMFARSRRSYASAQYMRAALAELPPALTESALVTFIVLFFVIDVLATPGSGGALSVLGLFAYVGLRLQPSLRKIVAATNNIKFGAAAVDDVFADLAFFRASVPTDEGEDRTFRRSLELRDVEFRYESSHKPALTEVSFVIRRGEAIGVCGPTGGGKSTLVDVLIGLLHPTKGRVLVDGGDIDEGVRTWQRQLGVVSQSVFLIDGSLRENIALGLPREEIDDFRIAEAVRLAQLEPFIATLPDGLDTKVGERGVRISGGQRQRVAIARALYGRPSVLLFDEGTSSLDNQTEAELIAALEGLRGERTIIMVAHRLSTVRRCDRILLIEDGRLSDVGNFDALAERHELFASFGG